MKASSKTLLTALAALLGAAAMALAQVEFTPLIDQSPRLHIEHISLPGVQLLMLS